MSVVSKIDVVKGDITKQNADAIVNAAKHTLLGGGGVDGAIHKAAGPELLQECSKLDGCNTGEAKITKGYKLPAKYVIHTVGPIWKGGNNNEETLLRNCYKNSLNLAVRHGIKTIAFTSVSTGVFHFPIDIASEISLREVKRFLELNTSIQKVTFVCFTQEDFDSHQQKIKEIFA